MATNNLTHESLPLLVRCLGAVIKLFGWAPEDYADIAIWQHASAEWKAKEWTFFDRYMREVTPDERVVHDAALRTAVWDKMLELSGEKEI